MLAKIQYSYIIWGMFTGQLVLLWLWCRFVAYPVAFEKKLKKGKSWVYIPLRWKGFHKVQVTFFSRVLMAGLAATGVLLLRYYTRHGEALWLLAFALGMGALVFKLNSWWTGMRYRQQEDTYYFLHDELRTKLEGEGKDIADSAFKNLAAYQHHNLLRKADETGQLIQTLKTQARQSRRRGQQPRSKEPVES